MKSSETELTGSEVLLIGYGNELRGDDGIGPHVARAIQVQQPGGVTVTILDDLVPELAATIASWRVVFFVDARMNRQEEPVEVISLEPTAVSNLCGHLCEPASLLSLAQALYGRAPLAWWITVAGRNFDLGERLSPEALANAKAAVTKIINLLETLLQEPTL
jgi:hydrogenase maturation protease